MTDDINLLPLPKWMSNYTIPPDSSLFHEDVILADRMRDYARANVAHVIAVKDAEIERLRAEVERLKSMTAVTMGIGRGDGNLFVHGDYDSIKVAQSLVFSAKRMEKALKDIRSPSSINPAMNPNPFALTVMLGDIYQIADAALLKEKDNE